jgi:uncharacterized protein YeaO (DUF488 family)
MPIRTRRWNDPKEEGDGLRILVCRYRPRGVPKSEETWDLWMPDLGPSKELHAAVYGKGTFAIDWMSYRRRYLSEMRARGERIEELAKKVKAGETITLLCSSACERESRCHRSLLKELIEKRMEPQIDADERG